LGKDRIDKKEIIWKSIRFFYLQMTKNVIFLLLKFGEDRKRDGILTEYIYNQKDFDEYKKSVYFLDI